MDLKHVLKSCLYSTVKNTSGVSRTFGFLPPHGVNLNPSEEYTVFGSILTCMVKRQDQIAFAAAIDRGDITIINTPNPILLDTGNGTTKMLQLHNNTLSAVNPCWDTSDSLDVTPPVGPAWV